MKAVVTVTGSDRKGIIAKVSTFLSEHNINILDISQTILSSQFAMLMVVDIGECEQDLSVLAVEAEKMGKDIGMSVRIQHEDLFQAMHRI